MSIDDNSNLEGKAYGNYISEVSKGWLKIQGYHDLFNIIKEKKGTTHAIKFIQSVWNGDIYVHDSTSIQIPYCWSYSTFFILAQGSQWGQLHSKAPNRTGSFIDQVKEVTIEIAQEIAGAVAMGDLFVNYAYLAKKQNLDVNNPVDAKQIENEFQSLVHTLNKKLRASHQSPFSNLSIFDRPNLVKLFGDLRYPDGSSPDFDLIESIQKIFTNWFAKGDPTSGLPYRFPVVTLNIRIDENGKILDQKAFDYFSEVNLDKGCFNIYISSGNKIASCCRLVNDLDLAGTDSFGNGGVSIGSHRVVTTNMARLGKIANSYEEFKTLLIEKLEMSKEILLAHRSLLEKRKKEGFLKFFDLNIMNMKSLFSTFGVNGIYEALIELGYSIKTKEGQALTKDILTTIKDFSTACSKKYGTPFNVEQVPAESLAIKFAKKDKILHNMDYDIYANQFIPLYVDYDIIDRIKLDGEFSKALTGGGITHLNIGEKLTSKDQMKSLIKYAIQTGCEHFAVNYNFASCANNHVTVAGPNDNCPTCNAPIVQHYTRVIGYFTPVSSWNKGRQKEHTKRVFQKNIESDIGIKMPMLEKTSNNVATK